jgi:hypothetical protein
MSNDRRFVPPQWEPPPPSLSPAGKARRELARLGHPMLFAAYPLDTPVATVVLGVCWLVLLACSAAFTWGMINGWFWREFRHIPKALAWLLGLSFIVLPWWLAWYILYIRRAHVRARRALESRCVRCGYDLRETPGRCPECGHSDAAENGVQQQGRKR